MNIEEGVAQDATLYLAMGQVSNLLSLKFVATYVTVQEDSVSFGISKDISDRKWFIEHGSLNRTSNLTGEVPALNQTQGSLASFAFSKNLGNISKTSNPIVFALGLVRDPGILFSESPEGTNKMLSPYFMSEGDVPTTVSAVIYRKNIPAIYNSCF
jgi:hypothetical protein